AQNRILVRRAAIASVSVFAFTGAGRSMAGGGSRRSAAASRVYRAAHRQLSTAARLSEGARHQRTVAVSCTRRDLGAALYRSGAGADRRTVERRRQRRRRDLAQRTYLARILSARTRAISAREHAPSISQCDRSRSVAAS